MTGGVEDWYEALDAIRSERDVCVPAAETLRTVREPAFLQEIAHRCGFDFPAWMEPGEREVPEGWLIKSRRLSGGLGVRRGTLARPAPHDYFQTPAAGRPCGAAFLANGVGAQLIGVTRSMTRAVGPRPFLYGGSAGPLRIGAETRERLHRLGETIRSQVGIRGLFGVDLLCPANGEEISLLEINPRYTAGMELLESGRDRSLVTAHVEAFQKPAALLLVPPQRGGSTACCVKRVVWTRQPLRWNRLWQLRIAEAFPGVTLHDVPEPGAAVGSGQPLVSLKTEGERMDECLRRARRVERQLLQWAACDAH